jgi:multidrug efflux pump subunit AcrA (membrane-fusion protein)
MKMSRSFLKLALPVLLLILGTGGFSYLIASRPESPKPKPKEKVWQVEVLEARPQRLAPSLTLYGAVETPALLQAAAPGPGLVTEVRVRRGDAIEQGQLLLALDPRDFQLAVAQAEADMADLEAQLADLELRHRANRQTLRQEQRLLKLAQAELTRVESLRQQNLSSEADLDTARNALGRQELAVITRQSEVERYAVNRKQLEARLQRNRARRDQALLALERSRIISPFDGIVATLPVATGDRVQTAQVLISLYPQDRLEVRARIPIRYQAEIQNALDQAQPLSAEAELTGHPIPLELDRLAGEADPSGIDGYFRVTAGAQRLRLGNLLKLNLSRPAQADLIAIPFQAIYGNNRIYLLRDGRMQGIQVEAVGRQLTREPEAQARLLIRSPELRSGERIIRTHLPNAVSGLKVEETGTPSRPDSPEGESE